jgi:hypothetical protein
MAINGTIKFNAPLSVVLLRSGGVGISTTLAGSSGWTRGGRSMYSRGIIFCARGFCKNIALQRLYGGDQNDFTVSHLFLKRRLTTLKPVTYNRPKFIGRAWRSLRQRRWL